jgi:hypothetical protein
MKRTHGMSEHRLYDVWVQMVKRCDSPEHKDYPGYGGRGISVCDEWHTDRATFFAWALGHGYQPGLTIDRIDNGLGYSPGNCRWLTSSEHARQGNTRRSHNLTWNGQTRTLAEWSRILNCHRSSLRMRVTLGWPVERIFSEPFQRLGMTDRS